MDPTNPADLSIGRTYADVVRKTTVWYMVLAPLTLLYLAVSLSIAWKLHPVSGLLGMPGGNADAILLDFAFVMLPMICALIWYLQKQATLRRRAREDFLTDFVQQELVQATTNPNLIYVVMARDADGGVTKMQLVWTPDGRGIDGPIYDAVDPASVKPCDTARFLDG